MNEHALDILTELYLLGAPVELKHPYGWIYGHLQCQSYPPHDCWCVQCGCYASVSFTSDQVADIEENRIRLLPPYPPSPFSFLKKQKVQRRSPRKRV